jgi:hypothetical protein
MLYEPFPSWLRELISRLEALFEAIWQAIGRARTAMREASGSLWAVVTSSVAAEAT